MNKIKDFFWYAIFAGGGSIMLTYFIPSVFRQYGIVLMMGMGIIIALEDILTDTPSNFRLQLSPLRRPKGSKSEVDESNGPKGTYYGIGTLIFGTLALIFIL